MATIKQERYALEQLLNGVTSVLDTQPSIQSVPPPVTPVAPVPQQTPVQTPVQSPAPSVSPMAAAQTNKSFIDNTSGSGIVSEPAFEFDYDAIKRNLRRRARRTVMNIITHIIPEKYVSEEYIQDKAEQDITTLSDLYMQLEVNNIMQRSLMESVAKGNSMPRMYEVFGQLSDKISAINKQIVATEQTVRKTYIDLKFEIHDKENEQEDLKQLSAPDTGKDTKQLTDSNIITSAKQLIDIARKKHMEKMDADAKEADIQDAEIIEME